MPTLVHSQDPLCEAVTYSALPAPGLPAVGFGVSSVAYFKSSECSRRELQNQLGKQSCYLFSGTPPISCRDCFPSPWGWALALAPPAGTGPSFMALLEFCDLPVDGFFGTTNAQDLFESLSTTCTMEVPTAFPEKAWTSSPLLGRGSLDIELSPCMQLI